MDDKSTAKKRLAELIKDYERLDRNGILKGQSEATARTWVERFLAIFGWDPSDPHQVRQEYRIQGRAARRLKSEGTSHRRPDYCLISNDQRILYIDVKKFDANLKDDSGISYQVRCYGWSEKFKVSYAFDFDELAIYDCRIRPQDADEADIARIHYLRHDQYLDNFEILWDFFAKNAIDGGSLSRLLPDDDRPEGMKTLDQDFEERLSVWRRELGKSILRYGKIRDAAVISASAQRILDRIVFLRICEAFGFEELGTLLEMAHHEDGFWPLFLEEHEKRYSRIYDGILFPASQEDDPTGIDAYVRSWWLKGRVFRDIVQTFYYPHPYCFDVIPIELLGGIYEKYLGKKLRVVGNDVTDEFKPEYQRTKGAVYTPSWIVRRIIGATLAPIADGKDPEDLLRLKILDPACGSASFLLGAFDFLEECVFAWFEEHPGDRRRTAYIADTDDGPRLTQSLARNIIDGCLYGVDIDPEAIEIARMSLALKYLDRASVQGAEPEALLKGIGLNIRHGNSLVGPDIIGLGIDAADVVQETMPFDWHSRTTGFGKIMDDGGFDAVVGNPPYIEVKRYKEWMPAQYHYLKNSGNFETTVQGKTDVAMPFMERGLMLLRPEGRLGYIIQNRFFKTDYGEIVRAWLIRQKAVSQVEDFRDIQIFAGRTTYTAILILQKNSSAVRYRTYASIADAEAKKASVDIRIVWKNLDANVWSFDQPELLDVHRELAGRHGTIGDHRELQISVGLQTLYGKLYQFEAVEVKPRTLVGRNGDGEIVSLEKAALRPLCRNRGFYPFRCENADAWVIFPYDVAEGSAREILWKEFKKRFPKTAEYLEERKRKLANGVELEEGPNRWHLYRYPKNLVGQARPKVLFPMTIEDTMASVDLVGDIYQDNVNVNSLSFDNATPERLKATAAVFNSTLFNALAKLKAGLNEAGWRKFNRQYAELVPFPMVIVQDGNVVEQLSLFADQISSLQERAHQAISEGTRRGLRATLESLWNRLDEAVETVYGLNSERIGILKKYPRRIDRVDLLTRQIAVPEDD